MKKHKPVNQEYVDLLPPQQLKLTPAVFAHIRDTIGSMKAEHGGILGGCRETGEVNFFFFDDTGEQTRASYSPDVTLLNTVIKKHWKPNGFDFMGFVHTHPSSSKYPSLGDEEYAKRILDAMGSLPYLLTPIAMSIPDTGTFQLYPYAIVRDGKTVRIMKQKLVVDGQSTEMAKDTSLLEEMSLATSPIPWEVVVLGSIGLLSFYAATVYMLRVIQWTLEHYNGGKHE